MRNRYLVSGIGSAAAPNLEPHKRRNTCAIRRCRVADAKDWPRAEALAGTTSALEAAWVRAAIPSEVPHILRGAIDDLRPGCRATVHAVLYCRYGRELVEAARDRLRAIAAQHNARVVRSCARTGERAERVRLYAKRGA